MGKEKREERNFVMGDGRKGEMIRVGDEVGRRMKGWKDKDEKKKRIRDGRSERG